MQSYGWNLQRLQPREMNSVTIVSLCACMKWCVCVRVRVRVRVCVYV